MKTNFTIILFFLTVICNSQIINFPNANFKARLLSAAPNNFIASTQSAYNVGGVTTFTKIDTNSDGEIQVSEAAVIQYLNVFNGGFTDLTGINYFTNLKTLYCHDNQLTTLNISGLTSLIALKCENNNLSSLNINGLTSLQELYLSYNQLATINLNGFSNLKFLRCEANQFSSLNLIGLTNLQKLYCAANQISSLNVSGLTSLQELDCSYNQITSLDVNSSTNLNIISCGNNQLNALFIKNNNPNWISLDFSNNPNLTYICADDANLSTVQQKINSYGYAATCQVNSYCSFTPGGTFYTIQGNHKFDFNNNGCDVLDAIYPNLKFNITDGTTTGSLISNSTGSYSIPVAAGAHTVMPQFENPTYFNASPASATVTFPATTSPFTQDFCIVPNGIHHDIEIVVIPIISARPGFDATYKIKYKNKGVVTENGTLSFNYNEPILDYVSSSVAPTTQSSGMLSWNIGSIAPFQSGEIIVTLNVNSPTETPAVNAGDYLSFIATIIGLNTDETPIDNTFALAQVVVNSFDPNDKTCLEGSTINPTNIGKYVHYMIRFENNGTFPAQNIVVKDMIDTTKFDVSTLQMIDASHSCIARITNPDKVEFIFENINLPFDDANNNGYVAFKVKTKSTLVLGNSFSNLANIYFDYNFPIITNNYTTTIQNTLGTNQFKKDNVTTFPNPVKDILQLKTIEKVVKIEVYDITGRILSSNSVNENKIDLTALKTGNYILKVYTENGITTTKMIKD